jgi:flagellar biogenesis protein FliO
MSSLMAWVARRFVSLFAARFKWMSRVMTVVSVLGWLVARRRRSAVVRLKRGETLVVGVERQARSIRGGSSNVV